jgi:filamentous hemagglutinin
LNTTNGQWNVTANSTLTGTINFFQYNTFNIGGSNGAHTLNVSAATIGTVSGGANPFIIGAGGTLNNSGAGASSIAGGGVVQMNGGSITSTGGGLFTIGDQINGNGTISGNVALTAGSETVTGGNMTWNGVTIGTNSSGPGVGVNGNTLDLQGNITVPTSFNVNPGTGGTVQLDGTTISGPTGTNHFVNNSGLTTQGTFSVVGPNASTLNNIQFSTGNGANMVISAGLNLTGTSTLDTTNLTLGSASQLAVGSNNAVTVRGNFYNQSTNTGSSSYNGTSGLGPDLKMAGGTSSQPKTLEVGGVNQGYVSAGLSITLR